MLGAVQSTSFDLGWRGYFSSFEGSYQHIGASIADLIRFIGFSNCYYAYFGCGNASTQEYWNFLKMRFSIRSHNGDSGG